MTVGRSGPAATTTRVEFGPTPGGRVPARVWPASLRVHPTGEVLVGGVGLTSIAREHGTATHVLDLGELVRRCERYRRAAAGAEVAYAGKALLTRSVVRIVEEQGLSLDVCSAGELALALSCGFPAARIILHGNGKPRSLLSAAVRHRVGRVVVDDLGEIEELAACASAGRPQPVLLRVTPGVDAGTHRSITTGTEDQKFGLSIGTGAAEEAARCILAEPRLDLVGLHCHIGSQISRLEPYEQAARRVVGLMADIRDGHGHVVRELDLGGGHAIAYRVTDEPLEPEAVLPALRRAVHTACAGYGLPEPHLVVEPGRAIAGPCGLTLYRVLGIKRSGRLSYVTVDGGMSDNPRPALYGARYTVRLVGRQSSAPPRDTAVVGRHCESGDVIADDVCLPADLRVGDLLAVAATGAYHHAMGSNYNLTPRPPLVGVDGGRSRLLVRRETFADLVSRDVG